MVSFLVLATCAAAQLAPPALDRLPAGAIHPRGWLKAQAEAQVSGFTGGCTVSPICGIMQNKWLANDNHKLTGGEQGGGYFLNGFMPLTCQVDVGDELRALREATIDKNLLWANQTGGWFGGEIPHGNGSTVPTYWGRMSVVLAFQSYAECEGAYAPTNATAQAMVQDALLTYHKLIGARIAAHDPPFVDDPWGAARYQEVLVAVQWLIDRGHNDAELWDLMAQVHAQELPVIDWETWFVSGDPYDPPPDPRCWPNNSDPTQQQFMSHHGVNLMEAIKTGPAWYRVSGEATDADNARAALAFIDEYERSPDGTFTAPDCFAQVSNVPTNGAETCSVVEAMFSLRFAYETTADAALFDRLELVAFNAMPATTDANFTGNSYYHAVNQLVLSGKTGYSPYNGCCTGNVHQGWPKFIMSGVQTMHAHPEHVVISGYAPFAATLASANVSVGGQYPFADNATIALSRAAGGAPWALTLRIPCWVDAARLHVDGGGDPIEIPPSATCGFFDVPGLDPAATDFAATLVFDASIVVTAGAWSPPAGAIEIRRGPLLFSYPVNGTVNVTEINATMVESTRVDRVVNASFGIALENPNASALVFSGFGALNAVVPFDRAQPPATITARARMTTGSVQADYEKNGMPPPSPVKAEDCNGTAFDVELVPMAHTHLRLTVLPVLEDVNGTI